MNPSDLIIPLLLAGAVAAMMVACGDRATEILHRL